MKKIKKMNVDICVLIPYFNDLERLEKTLNSVSGVEPVDVLIVDDGSYVKPDIKKLKKKFSQINNILLIVNNKNRGIEYALNDGLRYIQSAGYKYIARLDCGDVCHPARFKIQKEYLEKNKNIYMVGSWVEFVDVNGKFLFAFRPPVEHNEIERGMFINNMFVHPAVLFRVDIIKEVGFYPLNYKNAEDYAYFFKIVRNFNTANINKFLLKCEINPKGLSLSKRKQQIKSRLKVILSNFNFSLYAFYGLFRNIVLWFLPYKLVELLKRLK